MSPIYLFAALVGWPFVLFFTFFGGDTAGDVDFDADTDLDHGGADSAVSDFLSIRGAIFFLAFFGGTGLLLGAFDVNGLITVATAIALGALGMVVNGALFRYIKASQSSSDLHDDEFQGRIAEVVLPIDDTMRGRVAVDFGGHRTYFVARPIKRGVAGYPAGERVVIIEIKNGTAFVAARDLHDQ